MRWSGETLVWLYALVLGQDRKGNGTQVLTHPDTAWTLCLANIQFTLCKASRILQLSLSWNRPLLLTYRIPHPTPITAGCRRDEVGYLDEAFSCYFAK